MYTTKMYQCL